MSAAACCASSAQRKVDFRKTRPRRRKVLAASYPFLDVMWTMLVFFLWVAWFMLLFRVFGDIFRRHDISGGAKTGWIILTILLPFLGVFIYIISQGDAMAKRDVERAQAQRSQFDDYVRETAGGGGGGAAAEIDK